MVDASTIGHVMVKDKTFCQFPLSVPYQPCKIVFNFSNCEIFFDYQRSRQYFVTKFGQHILYTIHLLEIFILQQNHIFLTQIMKNE